MRTPDPSDGCGSAGETDCPSHTSALGPLSSGARASSSTALLTFPAKRGTVSQERLTRQHRPRSCGRISQYDTRGHGTVAALVKTAR